MNLAHELHFLKEWIGGAPDCPDFAEASLSFSLFLSAPLAEVLVAVSC